MNQNKTVEGINRKFKQSLKIDKYKNLDNQNTLTEKLSSEYEDQIFLDCDYLFIDLDHIIQNKIGQNQLHITDSMFIDKVLAHMDLIISVFKPNDGLFIFWSGTGSLASVISHREKFFSNMIQRRDIANQQFTPLENVFDVNKFACRSVYAEMMNKLIENRILHNQQIGKLKFMVYSGCDVSGESFFKINRYIRQNLLSPHSKRFFIQGSDKDHLIPSMVLNLNLALVNSISSPSNSEMQLLQQINILNSEIQKQFNCNFMMMDESIMQFVVGVSFLGAPQLSPICTDIINFDICIYSIKQLLNKIKFKIQDNTTGINWNYFTELINYILKTIEIQSRGKDDELPQIAKELDYEKILHQIKGQQQHSQNLTKNYLAERTFHMDEFSDINLQDLQTFFEFYEVRDDSVNIRKYSSLMSYDVFSSINDKYTINPQVFLIMCLPHQSIRVVDPELWECFQKYYRDRIDYVNFPKVSHLCENQLKTNDQNVSYVEEDRQLCIQEINDTLDFTMGIDVKRIKYLMGDIYYQGIKNQYYSNYIISYVDLTKEYLFAYDPKLLYIDIKQFQKILVNKNKPIQHNLFRAKSRIDDIITFFKDNGYRIQIFAQIMRYNTKNLKQVEEKTARKVQENSIDITSTKLQQIAVLDYLRKFNVQVMMHNGNQFDNLATQAYHDGAAILSNHSVFHKYNVKLNLFTFDINSKIMHQIDTNGLDFKIDRFVSLNKPQLQNFNPFSQSCELHNFELFDLPPFSKQLGNPYGKITDLKAAFQDQTGKESKVQELIPEQNNKNGNVEWHQLQVDRNQQYAWLLMDPLGALKHQDLRYFMNKSHNMPYNQQKDYIVCFIVIILNQFVNSYGSSTSVLGDLEQQQSNQIEMDIKKQNRTRCRRRVNIEKDVLAIVAENVKKQIAMQINRRLMLMGVKTNFALDIEHSLLAKNNPRSFVITKKLKKLALVDTSVGNQTLHEVRPKRKKHNHHHNQKSKRN